VASSQVVKSLSKRLQAIRVRLQAIEEARAALGLRKPTPELWSLQLAEAEAEIRLCIRTGDSATFRSARQRMNACRAALGLLLQ
jgi:hypothetical protein